MISRHGSRDRGTEPTRDGRAKIVVPTAPGLQWYEAVVERVGEVEDALAERMGGQGPLEELAAALEELKALSAERNLT